MVPGEYLLLDEPIELNAGRPTIKLLVANGADRPVQVGSHYHFYEVNPALQFERARAYGMRLNIPAGTAVRFEPGAEREVELVPYEGQRIVLGFRGAVMGALTEQVPQAARPPQPRDGGGGQGVDLGSVGPSDIGSGSAGGPEAQQASATWGGSVGGAACLK